MVTELQAVAVAQATSLPEADVTLVATLLLVPLGEPAAGSAGPAILTDEVFAVFNPSFLTPQRSREAVVQNGGGDGDPVATGGSPVAEGRDSRAGRPYEDSDEVLQRNRYRSGLEDSFERRQRQNQADLPDQAAPAPRRVPDVVEPAPDGPDLPGPESLWRKGPQDLPDLVVSRPRIVSQSGDRDTTTPECDATRGDASSEPDALAVLEPSCSGAALSVLSGSDGRYLNQTLALVATVLVPSLTEGCQGALREDRDAAAGGRLLPRQACQTGA